MKIASTDLALQAEHAALTRQESQETLRAWRGERPDFERNTTQSSAQPTALASAIASISATAREQLAAATIRPPAVPSSPSSSTASASGSEATAIEDAMASADNNPFILLIKRMIELMTGKEVKVFDMQSFSAELHHTQASVDTTAAQAQATAGEGRAGYGIEYDYHAVREEIETTDFSAEGTIRTTDGQEINFRLDLEMSRYYREETNISLRAGDAKRKDPLVVNFGGTAAQLAGQVGQRFRFDLDGDGRAEDLPLFASGSGYLALDLNRNGRIDSGKELFGPQSGNGFADLARLDGDNNGWIDSGDADFSRLSVWTPATEGPGKLQSLEQLGIGALGLTHVATPFALRGADNTDLGLVKSSGVYLSESGKAGSIQEVDLTV